MTTLTETQHQALIQTIYDHLITLPDDSGETRGLGEMGDTRDEARGIVDSWMESQGIQTI